MFPDKIEDIKFFGGRAYFLKSYDLDSEKYEEQLSKLKYSGAGREKIKSIENSKLPPFILAFSMFLFYHERIPNQIEIFDLYFKRFIAGKYELDKEGVRNRLLRAYPSIIRDFHFFLRAGEIGEFQKVVYSIRMDYDGIDVMINYKDVEFAVSLNVDTLRSRQFKTKKYSRHDYSDKNEIVLTLDLKNAKKVSNFFLYPDSHIKILKTKMEEKLSK